MSFTVLSTGTQWNDFKLKTDYNFGFCYGTTEVTVSKPGNFPTSQFSYTSSTYSFAGQFTSSTTASGTYSFVNDYITGCGYLTRVRHLDSQRSLATSGAFSKTAPANGATELSINPSLSWGSSMNANSYEYCYDTTDNASCDTAWNSVGTATSTVLSGLIERTTYYWQLRAIGSSGTTYADGGTWWTFTTALFADVPADYWSKSWIERLYNAGITGGCVTNPLQLLSRKHSHSRTDGSLLIERHARFKLCTACCGSQHRLHRCATRLLGSRLDQATSRRRHHRWMRLWKLLSRCNRHPCANGGLPLESQTWFILFTARRDGVFTDVPVGYWADKWIEQLGALKVSPVAVVRASTVPIAQSPARRWRSSW